jgi:hypothetical protein
MAHTINPELLALATRALLEKSAVVPPQGPAAADMGVVAPATPAQAVAGAAPPSDPAAAGAAPPAAPPGMVDPAMMGALPPAQPAPAQQPAQQKLKPEQMMQMLDYRLYNMQQQLTAIMNAMGVQVAPESLVLPPGTTGAPPAETALPGGPMAPPPVDPNAAAGGAAPAAGGPPMPEAPKMAEWWAPAATPQPIDLQTKASAVAALCRSLANDAR